MKAITALCFIGLALVAGYSQTPPPASSTQTDSVGIVVLGQVKMPGLYKFTMPNLLDAIAAAGGVQPQAVSSRVEIIRLRERISVDLGAILSGKAANRQLQQGDLIYVPRRSESPTPPILIADGVGEEVARFRTNISLSPQS